MAAAVDLLVLAVIALSFAAASLFKIASLCGLRWRRGWDWRRFASDWLPLLPVRVREGLVLALPFVEAALAVGIFNASGVVYQLCALLSLLLFVLFGALIALRLHGEQRPSCQCFGEGVDAPVTWRSVWRNLALAGCSIMGVVNVPGQPADVGLREHWVQASIDARVTALVMFVAVGWMSWLSIQLPRRGRVRGREWARGRQRATPIASLENDSIPEAYLTRADGTTARVSDLARAQARILVFVAPSCEGCADLVRSLDSWPAALGGDVEVSMVSLATATETAIAFPHYRHGVWFDSQGSAAQALKVRSTPAAVALGNGIIAAGPAHGAQEIGDLLTGVLQAVTANLAGEDPTADAPVDIHGAALTYRRDGQGLSVPEDATAYVSIGGLPSVGTALVDSPVARGDGSATTLSAALREIVAEFAMRPGRRAVPDDPEILVLAWDGRSDDCLAILPHVRRLSEEGAVVVVTDDPVAAREQGLSGPVLQTLDPGGPLALIQADRLPAAVPLRGLQISRLGAVGGAGVLELATRPADGEVGTTR